MERVNCWEHKLCGRQPGGSRVDDLGICPAASDERLDEVHGGINAGRACWAVAGTLCGGEPQGTFARKYGSCSQCDFFHRVRREERGRFKHAAALLAMLHG